MAEQLFVGEQHTQVYSRYRPNYPRELFDLIEKFYFHQQPTNEEKIPLAIDVACGSGQATIGLSSFCDRVIGLDVSANQIAHAVKKENIEYRCQPAEDLTFLASNSVDLITVATALHWFNVERFFQEVQRVLKAQTGVVAIWTYTYGRLDNLQANEIYHHFHQDILTPYWNSKGGAAIEFYEPLLHLFPYQKSLQSYSLEHKTETTIEEFLGYVKSLSACETYRKQEGEQAYSDLLGKLRSQLIECYAKTFQGNVDQIRIIVTHPIKVYLMRKEN